MSAQVPSAGALPRSARRALPTALRAATPYNPSAAAGQSTTAPGPSASNTHTQGTSCASSASAAARARRARAASGAETGEPDDGDMVTGVGNNPAPGRPPRQIARGAARNSPRPTSSGGAGLPAAQPHFLSPTTMSLLDLVQQQLGPSGTEQIATQIGADPGTTNTAIQAALPMLLGGMAGAARQPGGADAIAGLLGQGGGGGGLGGMLGGLLGGGAAGGGLGGLLGGGGGLGGMLGSILGGHQDAVQDGVQQSSGLSGDQTKRLLAILAPIVLAALAHRHQQQQAAGAGAGADLDGNGIPDALEHEAREAQAQAPGHVGGLVGKILDMAQRPARQ